MLFEQLLNLFNEKGLLKSRGKQRTDSSYILASLRRLNRLELIGETLRHTLNELASHYPTWLTALIEDHWLDSYGKRVDEYRLPKAQEARQILAEQIAKDGYKLLNAAALEGTSADLQVFPAIETLRRIWEQEFLWEQDKLIWRADNERSLSMHLVQSPYEQEARYAFKCTSHWVGYKVHLTESCDEALPHLIVNVKTSLATSPDQNTLPDIHKNLARRDLLPSQQFVDAGYTDLDSIVASAKDYEVEVIGPVHSNSSWQAKVEGAYQNSDFLFDWERQIATCPQGKTTHYWKLMAHRGQQWLQVRFHKRDCDPCPVRSLCTRAKNEARYVRIRLEHERMVHLRQQQETAEWKSLYKKRAGIEGTISQSLRITGLREARYRGLAKTHLQDLLSASALNLIRLSSWFAGEQPVAERNTAFEILCAACA